MSSKNKKNVCFYLCGSFLLFACQASGLCLAAECHGQCQFCGEKHKTNRYSVSNNKEHAPEENINPEIYGTGNFTHVETLKTS